MDRPNGEPRPPTAGEQLGLGAHWQPAPASLNWHTLQRSDGGKLYVLRFETPVGVVGIAFDQNAIRQLADAAMALATGLHVATGLPRPQDN